MTTRGFAVTDIQGSARLWDRLGASFAPLLAEHNRILLEASAAHGGRVLRSEGDSFSFAFPDGASALRCSGRILTDLHAHPWPEAGGELQVRIGVHSGGVETSREEDCQALRLAGLIAAASHGGQILASGDARCSTERTVPELLRLDLGVHRLTEGAPPVRLFQWLPSGLASRRFPPPRTLDAPRSNVPPDSGRFLGRESVLAELAALLPVPAGRLVTLTGPAGIGKSRLAREVARSVLPSFPGGCWLADLSGARTAVDIASVAARVLGAPIEQNAPVEALADVLRFRNPLLLILDGVESLTAHVAAVLGPWMREARQARFLVTSRVLLGLAGERDVPVRPLDLPAGVRDTGASPAIALFAERAAAAAPGFTLSEAAVPHVLSICRALDGIPLSIEIAASRLRDLPLERVAQELERDAGALHDQGSAAAVTWSLASLAPWVRAALRQLALFRGGFFLEAAEAVVDLSVFQDAPLVIDAIQTLCDQSFLRTDDLPQGTRFTLFRQVQELSLREGLDEAAARRHAEWVLRHGREWAARVHTPRAREALDQLDAERDNLSAALERTGGEVAAELILAYEDALIVRGSMFDLERMQRRVLQDTDLSDASRIRLEVAHASVLLSLGQYALALDSATRALRPAPSGVQAHARILIGFARLLLGFEDEAREELDRALACARAAGDVKEEATALVRTATVLDQQGHTEEALDLASRGLEIDRQLGSPLLVARDTGILGMILGHVGRTEEALQVLNETRRFAAELGHRAHEASVTGNMGTLVRDARPMEALRLHAEAEAIFRDLGRSPSAVLQTYNRGRIYFDLGRLGEAAECLEPCLAHAESVGNRIRSIWYGSLLGLVMSARGNHDRAIRLLDQAVARCREVGDAREEAACRVRQVHAMFRAGRPVEPSALPDAGSVSDDRNREAGVLFELRALHAFLASRSGDTAAAAAHARQILQDGVPPRVQAHHWTAGLYAAVIDLSSPGSP